MSEQKKPQAGQYWIHDKTGDKAYFIGKCPSGVMVWQCEGDDIEHGDLDWSGWHHESRCTGWDWQPEPEHEWFDLTPHDGHVLRGVIDEWHCTLAGRNKWVDGVQWPEGTTVADAKSWRWKQFRCLLKDSPPELLNPVESPKSRWRTPQLNEEPHQDAQYWNRSLQSWVRRGCPKDRYSKMETYRVPVCVMCGTRDVIAGTDTCADCTKDAIPEPKPATQTIVFHEVILRHDLPKDHYTMSWMSDVPKHSNWIPTGRTETREVVR